MVFAEEIRKTILKLAEERGSENSFAPADVARVIDQHNWQHLLDQVRLVADSLVKEGKITASPSASSESMRFKKS